MNNTLTINIDKEIQKLHTFLDTNKIPYEKDVSLKKKTWIHRGGNCSTFISPMNSNCLKILVQFLYKENISFLTVGHTSNIYILNECDIPVVVSTTRCNNYNINKDTIVCDCGVSVSRMAKDLTAKSIAGFEQLHELPGTVGGAIYNNSSCLSCSISGLLISATIITENGELAEITKNDFDFKYRTSIMKEKRLKGVIIQAKLKLINGDAKKLEKIAAETNERRRKNLEGKSHNLGCTVNQCFCIGQMPLKYKLPSIIYDKIVALKEKDYFVRIKKHKDFLCKISGYKHICKYISDKSIITFMWKDENADAVFSDYLEFMRKIYKTDKVEIEIIKKQL